MPLLLEVCCDSVAGALAAKRGGADRLELCAGLVEGGVTPSIGMVKQVVAAVNIPVMVLIRPRRGDFVFSKEETAVMCDDIDAMGEAGVAGVVIGALTATGDYDKDVMTKLLDRANHHHLQVTFHRAIDMSWSPAEVLRECMKAGINRVLTSGGQNAAVDGLETIDELNGLTVDSSLKIIAAAGVSESNVSTIVLKTGVDEVHGSLRSALPCSTQFKKEGVYMGVQLAGMSEFEMKSVDETRVKAVRDELSNFERKYQWNCGRKLYLPRQNLATAEPNDNM